MKINLRNFYLKSNVIFAAVIAVLVIGACSKYSYKAGMEAFNSGYYGRAADIFENVAKNQRTPKSLKDSANFMAGESYRLNDKYDKAEKFYSKVIAKHPNNTDALIQMANMQRKSGNFKSAIENYDKYLLEVPGDSVAIKRRAACERALAWNEGYCARFKVENFKIANSRQNDWAPMIASKKDNLLFFVSDRAGGTRKTIYDGTMEAWTDLWYMEKTGKGNKAKWGRPILLPKANTKFNDGSVTFDSKYANMYMTQCNGPTGKDSDVCRIYEMKKVGKDWEIGDALEFCKQDPTHFYGHPALSPDGTKLYFASNRDGGYGGFDIWVSTLTKRGKAWSEPVNLGPAINTEENEYFPYLNQHDNKLYFSSEGLPGIGGMDIFMATPTDDITVWKDVENLRAPINSSADDFGMTFWETDATKGFFTSNRGDRKYNYDIYSFETIPIVLNIKGTVTELGTNKPIPNALVTISNSNDTSVVRIKTDALGNYSMPLKEKTTYQLEAKKPEDYYIEDPNAPFKRTTKGIKCDSTLIQNFVLENPVLKLITLPIFYDLDKDFIRPDAARVLDTFANDILKKYPKFIAELGSHTDCRADSAYNVDLARRRADSARAYLIRVHKIDPKRVVAVGYGESNLVNDCKCNLQDVDGVRKTPYVDYVEKETGKRVKTRKMVVIKDERGNVQRSYYEDYKPSEIIIEGDRRYVPCDEFQHQQNRRTTVRFSTDKEKSRISVDSDKDRNNRNVTNKDTGSKKPGTAVTPAKPSVDESNATKVSVTTRDGKNYISTTVNETETVEFEIDQAGRITGVTPEVAAQWFTQKIINKGSFVPGSKEKIKVAGTNVKLPTDKFEIKKIEINGIVLENVVFTVTDKVNGATIGKSTFAKYFKPESYIKDGTWTLIPKKAPKKPKPDKVKKDNTSDK